MYSYVPFEPKISGITQENKEDFKQNKLPAMEVKGQGPHGIAFCSPSLHKYGHRYKILGKRIPEKVLTKEEAFEVMQHIDQICKKHGLGYLGENGKAQKVTVQELVREGAVIMEGNNRHNGLLKMSMSLVSKLRNDWTLSDIKEMAFAVANPIHCRPPIDRDEFDRNVWRSVMRYLPPEQVYEDAENKAMQEIGAVAVSPVISVSEALLADEGYHAVHGTVSTMWLPYAIVTGEKLLCRQCNVISEKMYDYPLPYTKWGLTGGGGGGFPKCPSCGKSTSQEFLKPFRYRP